MGVARSRLGPGKEVGRALDFEAVAVEDVVDRGWAGPWVVS